MIYPKFLQNESVIGVPAPSDGYTDILSKKRYENAVKKFKEMGYSVKLSKNMYTSNMARSASAEERAKEFNEMIKSKEIRSIICGAGGEFLLEILPFIDFEEIKRNPKWVQGFSDATSILFPITTKCDIATIYSRNFKCFGANDYHKSLVDNIEILKGNIVEQESYELYEEESKEYITGYEADNLTEKVEWKILNAESVNVTGRVLGGNFDCINEICATRFDGVKEFVEKYKDDGIIWFFDNFEMSKEAIIRALWKLNELGYFDHTKCIVFGRNAIEESFLSYTMEECLKDSVISKLNIPVVYDADVSHKSPCLNIVCGAIAKLEVFDKKAKISYEFR